MFVILAVVILGSAIMCVATKRIMRAATFLLFVLFGIAGMFFLLDYTYLGAAQISVYAGVSPSSTSSLSSWYPSVPFRVSWSMSRVARSWAAHLSAS